MRDLEKASFLKIKANPLSSMWTPVIVDVPNFSANSTTTIDSNIKLVLLSSIHGDADDNTSVSWVCVCLSPEPQAAQFDVEFFIKSLSPQVSISA